MIVSQRADAAFCQSILKKSGSNFALPLRLLSPEKRRGSNALYAFCRLADDIIDGEGALSDKSQAIDEFERMLRNALNGQVVDDPVLRSIACTADRYTIPHEHLFAIVKGVRSDLTQSRYETTDDLIEYCRRVASAVGLAAVPGASSRNFFRGLGSSSRCMRTRFSVDKHSQGCCRRSGARAGVYFWGIISRSRL